MTEPKTEDEVIAELARYWNFDKRGDTPNGIVASVAHQAYQAGLGAAVSASPQPPKCPKCQGINLALYSTEDGFKIGYCNNPLCKYKGTIADFFAPAPAQEPPTCNEKVLNERREIVGICGLKAEHDGKCDEAAQPVENSSRCRWCQETIRPYGQQYEHINSRLIACRDSEHHVAEPEPMSGGAYTEKQPPQKCDGLCQCCGTKLIRQELKLPHYVDWCSNCGIWAARPSEPSAKLCDFPFQGDCTQKEACLSVNRCLKNLPSAPKVEPMFKHNHSAGSDFCPECESTDRKHPVCLGKHKPPAQATETASAPQGEKMKVKVELELEYTQHWDDESKIFVIDIPAIGVLTQASEKNIERSTKSAAQMWLQLCLDRGTIRAWKDAELAAPYVAGTQPTTDTTEIESLRGAVEEAKKDATSWKHHWQMYRDAWVRELGGWLVPKSHEIDALVLTTRKRCVNPLLGNCGTPHWLGKPTGDRKALTQTPHPRENSCKDWQFDDSGGAAQGTPQVEEQRDNNGPPLPKSAREYWPIWCKQNNEMHHTVDDWPIRFANDYAAMSHLLGAPAQPGPDNLRQREIDEATKPLHLKIEDLERRLAHAVVRAHEMDVELATAKRGNL